MTREQMAHLLERLVLEIANNMPPPPDLNVSPQEWAYVKGMATARIMEFQGFVIDREP